MADYALLVRKVGGLMLTEGKSYRVRREEGDLFEIACDDGVPRRYLWEASLAGEWRRIHGSFAERMIEFNERVRR